MAPKKIHLVSNAHLDPVWLWEWEEGAAEALATFRQAAEFCEKYPGFVFCHNEAVLYEWVEEYEPALFRRIQDLVRENRWHVMGGWYIQPDCNMPSGESFVRQILLGRSFFKHKLGVEPKTAVNLDPFGHTRGLVQILAKSGYDNYLCCRPGNKECPLPSDEFVWVGYDGSEVLANRASAHYCSIGGKARARLEEWLAANPNRSPVIHLWGIGNHGGGPSRKDLEDFDKFRTERGEEYDLVHSTPDAYFAELEDLRDSLPRREKDLNPWAVGCYTSMSRVKQGHRQLENELFSAEKMVTTAWSQGLMDYPHDSFRKAAEDLAFTEFHDILPGSAIPSAEEAALRRIGHGLEILSRVKARAFFALASGERKAAPGELPIFLFNPHPYPVRTLVECEFEPWELNYEKTFWTARITHEHKSVASQVEKEASNLSVEWRKKVVFEASLEPARLARFDCRLESIPHKPEIIAREKGGFISLQNDELTVAINAQTGLLDLYQVKGLDYVAEGAFRPLVIEDNADPWGMKVRSFRTVEGAFGLATPEVAALHSGQRGGEAAPVRVIEEGDVRTVVESILAYGKSRIVFHYKIPKKGTAVEVEARVTWAEKDRMLKLSLPSRLRAPKFMGQVAFGADELPSNGDEAVAQKWLALVSEREDAAFTVINEGTYGSDYNEGELRLSLLRSPAYSADTWEDKLAVAQDRFIPRQDQGERMFRFWINGGPLKETMAAVDREALARNERPYVLPFCPAGGEKKDVKSGITVGGTATIVSAFKKAEEGDDIVIRLFEPTGTARQVTLGLPAFRLSKKLRLKGFEVRTMRFSPGTGALVQTDLLERHGGKK